MSRPLTRAQALENRAFLNVLRRTGNVRLAAREVGLKYGTVQHRRRVHPAFAVRWDAALAVAQAGLHARLKKKEKEKGRHGSKSRDSSVLSATRQAGRPAPSLRAASATRPASAALHSAVRHRTSGGEPVIVRLASGALQVRRAQPGKLTREAEQAFLAALSATCNMSLAAAAVGANFNAFNRRRKRDPGFAREVRLALAQGYEALELALFESTLPVSHEHDDWRHNAPPAMPPMSCNQALQLMYLHQKAALLVDEPTPMRRLRGESCEARSERLALMAEARDERAREEFEVAEAERAERGEPAWGLAGQLVRERLGLAEHFGLPDLAQVRGWSRADPDKDAHDPERALFGGWRIAQMEARLAEWELELGKPRRERGGPRVRRV